MCADAPDMTAVNTAAAANAEIGKEALDFYKRVYDEGAPARAKASETADKVSLAQLDAMNTQTAIAKDYTDYQKRTLRPLQEEIVQEARAFDTEAERERLAGLAQADVAGAVGRAREDNSIALSRSGVDPTSGRALAVGEGLSLAQAGMEAGAKNRARQTAVTLAGAKKADAAAMLQGLPSSQATATQIGLQAGNAAAGNAQIPGQVAAQGAQVAGQGYQTAMQGNTSAGNLYLGAANVQQRADDNSGLWGAAGNIAGKMGAAWVMSDENMKEDIAPADGALALSEVRKTPVKTWRYKKGSPGDDGGKPHVGPMAQAVRDSMGEEVAPGGKQVDVISLAGTALAAVKELDQRVIALERRQPKAAA